MTLPVPLPFDPLDPPPDQPWGYGLRPLPESIQGLVGRQLTTDWNQMPARWRYRPGGWPHDPVEIQRIIQKRTAEFTHQQHLIVQRYGGTAAKDYAYHQRKTSPTQAGLGFMLAIGALLYAVKRLGDPGSLWLSYDPELLLTNPTFIIDDWMETGKGFQITGTAKRPLIRLIPGAGVAYTKALVFDFRPITKGVWREGHIYYTLPVPLRKYQMVAFQAAAIGVEGPHCLLSWMQWNWAGFEYWSGFRAEPYDVLYPWEIMTPPGFKKLMTKTVGQSVTMGYTPTTWIVDTEIKEYTHFTVFGQNYNVKGYPITELERTKTIGPAELHFQVWHPWKTFCRVQLDSVIVAEFGPYRDDILREDKRRSKLTTAEPRLV